MTDHAVDAPSASASRPASRLLLVLGVIMVAGLIWLVVAWLRAIDRDYLDIEFVAVDPMSGEVIHRWQATGNEVPVIGDRVVMVTGGGVVGLRPDGDVAWRYDDGRAWRARVDAGTVLVDTGGGQADRVVLALDEVTGNERWRRAGNSGDIGGGVVLFDGRDETQVVDVTTGEVWADLSGRRRDTLFGNGAVALVIGRSLVLVSAEGERTLANDLPNRSLVAFTDGVVVVGHVPDTDERPRPLVLTAFGTADGAILWEQAVERFSDAEVDGGTLRLWRADDAVEITLETGTARTVELSRSVVPLATVADPEPSATVHRVTSTMTSPSDITYYVVASRAGSHERTTIAVESATGVVRWHEFGRIVAAANGVAALSDEHNRYRVIGDGGRIVAVVDKQGAISAVGAGDAIVILTGGTMTAIDSAGTQRVIADNLESMDRVAVATGDIIVVRRAVQTDRGNRIVLSAYDVASGDRLWRQRLRQFRSAEVDGGRLVLTAGRIVTELDLASGDAVAEFEAPQSGDASAQPGWSIATFDDDLSRLLWTLDGDHGFAIGTIGGTVIVATIHQPGVE